MTSVGPFQLYFSSILCSLELSRLAVEVKHASVHAWLSFCAEKQRAAQLQPTLRAFLTAVLVRQGGAGLPPGSDLLTTVTALKDLVLR